MTDGQLVLLILVAFTLFECARWVPGRAWAFQSRGGGKWKGSRPFDTFRSKGGAIALLSPIPPVEAHVVAAAWPCAPHEHGLCVWDDDSGGAHHIPWDQVKPWTEGAVLHLTADHRVRCIHGTSAKEWRALVKAWAGQTQEERVAGFETKAQAMLDPARLVEEASAMYKQTRWLRYVGGNVFWWTFLALPFTYWRYGDQWPTLAVAGVLLVHFLVQAILLWRQVRRHPALRTDAWSHLMSVALLPSCAMRAADWVCATLGPETHPLTALKAWGREEDLQKAAATAWRHARWPMGDFPMRPWDGPEVEVLRTFLASAGLDPQAWEAPPAPQEGCSRWCPRCLTQYTAAATTCSDCAGMPLRELPQGG